MTNTFTATPTPPISGPSPYSIGASNAQAQTRSTFRDTLLPRLISGQLRLPEAAPLEPTTP